MTVPRFFIEKRVIGHSKVSEDVSGTFGSADENGYRIDSETHFINPISARLSLDLSLIDHFTSEPPLGAKRNDLLFVSALRYSF